MPLRKVMRLLPLLVCLVAEINSVGTGTGTGTKTGDKMAIEHILLNTSQPVTKGDKFACENASACIISSGSGQDKVKGKKEVALTEELQSDTVFKCTRCLQFFHQKCLDIMENRVCPGTGIWSGSEAKTATGIKPKVIASGGLSYTKNTAEIDELLKKKELREKMKLTEKKELMEKKEKEFVRGSNSGRILFGIFNLVESWREYITIVELYHISTQKSIEDEVFRLLTIEGQLPFYTNATPDSITIICDDTDGKEVSISIKICGLLCVGKQVLLEFYIISSAELKLLLMWHNKQKSKEKPDATDKDLTEALTSMENRNLAALQILLAVLAHMQAVALYSAFNQMTIAKLTTEFAKYMFEDSASNPTDSSAIVAKICVLDLLAIITDELLSPARWAKDALKWVNKRRVNKWRPVGLKQIE